MPELPEVETIRCGLEPVLVGTTITSVTIDDERLTRPLPPAQIEQIAEHQTVASVDRRGKYLLIMLDGDWALVHHLRMTGSFSTNPPGPVPSHLRMTYRLSSGIDLMYRDIRRFGTLEAVSHRDLVAWLAARLGPEPLGPDFTDDYLTQALKGRTTPIKSLLLDQRVFCGVGNIYADEALFRAGIRPLRQARTLSATERKRLRSAVVELLTEAIQREGSTLRDYATVEGGAGGMQDHFFVYGRSHEDCLRCGKTLSSMSIAGRATVWCSSCQKRS